MPVIYVFPDLLANDPVMFFQKGKEFSLVLNRYLVTNMQ
jgi:hypothetical protein